MPIRMLTSEPIRGASAEPPRWAGARLCVRATRRGGASGRVLAAFALAAAVSCSARGPLPGPDPLPIPEDRWFAEGRKAAIDARANLPASGFATSTILFVGDGMSLTTVTAARILEGQLQGEPGEENLLAFEELPFVALAKTYNTNRQVPDSAGTMTAMMSGVKTKAAVIGLRENAMLSDHTSVDANRVATLFERAEERGLSTGVVTTARLTHATPAACYAHVPHRDWEDDSRLSEAARSAGFADIARQLVEFPHGDGLEVALGGGRRHFLPHDASDPEYPETRGRRADGRDLMAAWRERHAGSAVVWNASQLAAVDPDETDHLLGLFEPSHMQFEADRERDRGGEPSLAEMTARAIDILSRNPLGFVLVVEAGRIDHGHHLNNARRALVDTIALSDAVRVAVDRVDMTQTLVVVTADHGHTMSFGGTPTRGNPILGLVVDVDEHGNPEKTPALDGLGLPYTTLGYANGPGYTGSSGAQPEGAKRFPHRPTTFRAIEAGRPDLSNVDTAALDFLQESTVPLPMETHSGEDVPIYAGGAGSALFHGVREQTYIYHGIIEAMGFRDPDRVQP